MAANNYRDRMENARAVGGAPAAGGEAARQIVERMGGGIGSALGAVKSNVWDPAANALKTAITGDPTPIPGTAQERRMTSLADSVDSRTSGGRIGGMPNAPSRSPTQGLSGFDADTSMNSPANQRQFFNSPASAPTRAPSTDPMQRMTNMGWSNRGVPGAAGVTRFDKEGQSPIYTNVPGNTADWVQGGMKPGVNTISSSAMRGAAGGGGNLQATLAGNTALRDQVNFNSGGAMFRRNPNYVPPSPTRTRDEQNERDIRSAMQRLTTPYAGAKGQLTANQINAFNALVMDQSRGNREWDVEQLKGSNQLANTRAQGQNQLANTGLQGQYQLSNTGLQGQNQRANTDLQGQYQLEDTDRRGMWGVSEQGFRNAGVLDAARVSADGRRDDANFERFYTLATDPSAPAAVREDAERRLMVMLNGEPPPVQARADGGMVYGPQDFDSAIGYAQGGMVRGAGYGQTPDAAAVLPEVNEYREYAMGAQKLGLPAVPFEQFLTLRAGAQQVGNAAQAPQGAMGFANGGQVPDPRDVSGRMVMDADPNAPTDSIPAMVDETMPAKLDSGEFVIPADVVQFFGTDKLNKMIAAARQGAQG